MDFPIWYVQRRKKYVLLLSLFSEKWAAQLSSEGSLMLEVVEPSLSEPD